MDQFDLDDAAGTIVNLLFVIVIIAVTLCGLGAGLGLAVKVYRMVAG